MVAREFGIVIRGADLHLLRHPTTATGFSSISDNGEFGRGVGEHGEIVCGGGEVVVLGLSQPADVSLVGSFFGVSQMSVEIGRAHV